MEQALLVQARVRQLARGLLGTELKLDRMSGDPELSLGGRLLEWWSSGREEILQLGSAADSCTKAGSGRFPTSAVRPLVPPILAFGRLPVSGQPCQRVSYPRVCEWILYKSSFHPDVLCYNLLIDAYGQKLQHKKAESVYLQLLEAQCVATEDTYALLLRAYCTCGLLEKCEAVLTEMRRNGTPPVSEPTSFRYKSRAGFPFGSYEIFTLMQHMGCEPDRASYNIMVDAFGRAGLHEDAEAVFEELKQQGMTPTMKSHMLLLSAYSKAGNIPKCELIMNQMHKSGLKPDIFALNSMLNAYGRVGRFEKMEEVLTVMENSRLEADISTYNILINIYGRAGFLSRMEELFRALASKGLKADVVTWTSKMSAYARKKQYKKCLEIFEDMIDAGCYPDGGTAKVLLASCTTDEQIEQVTTIIRSFHKEARNVFDM
ncbi:hypothetical protein BHE74_00041606 [Ensete ventricosum]|nr:hypothetical protein BHE74_00041606 [Ensete ventricosum]